MDQLAEVGQKVVETLAGLLHALIKQITLVRYVRFPNVVFSRTHQLSCRCLVGCHLFQTEKYGIHCMTLY